MWLDILALLLLGGFVALGALRGGLASGLSLLTLAVAYGAAVVVAPRLAGDVAAYLDVAEVFGLVLAGSGAFLAGFLAMGIVTRVLTRIERRRGRQARSPRDRFLGGVFGGVRGALVVVLIAWLAMWVDALRSTGTLPGLPELGSSTAAYVTGELVEAGVGAAMADAGPSGRLVARMAARPGPTLGEAQALVESPHFEVLRSDKAFWGYVEHGAVDAAMNRSSFLSIVHDDELRRRLAELGLVEERAAADPAAFRAAAAEMLRQVGPRIRRIKTDPELQELAQDPEVQAMLQSGNTLALLSHPSFRRVVGRALEAERADAG